MTKRIVGVFATVALLSSGVALAGGEKHQKTQSGQQVGGEATGGSGQAQHTGAQTGQMLGEKQISGTVLKSSSSELKLRTDSGVISVKIDKNTQFQDPNVKHIKDLKEGQQVRTSFTVEKDANLARSVSLDTGMGGSGLDTDKGINQDIGGSGVDQQGSHDLSQPDMGGATHEDGKTY
ncbi:hypothetical protein [Melittangium boletus]|uniref:DUF5666 domain-containing protein n=1 Tax=Melittangium boletus DSM 14713 TaxID=1294270 RepID=A0A250IKQ7_9BACT|nr:hypothetical protein [Melittangium boletus]ATB31813.1 hypothetical protein MEBOL_005282 [Melittangium boletus DSM 14713]